MVLSVLFTHIKHRATRMQHQPPTLYLQADNCYAENKNQFMLAFLSMLVLRGVFREIYLYFLPSGHTHEDVDQMFSVFRKELNISSAELPEDLLALLERAYVAEATCPSFLEIMQVWDWKVWLGQHINDVQHQSQPRAFRFFQHEDVVVCQAKKGATDGLWGDMHCILPHLPPGSPAPIPRTPLPEKTVAQTTYALRSDVIAAEKKSRWAGILEQQPGEPVDDDESFWFGLPQATPIQPMTQNNSNAGYTDLVVTPRATPARQDMSFRKNDFIAIHADQTQLPHRAAPFWIAQIAKVCKAKLKVRYWAQKGPKWIPDTSYTAEDYIWPTAVLTKLQNFNATHVLTKTNKNQILQIIKQKHC